MNVIPVLLWIVPLSLGFAVAGPSGILYAAVIPFVATMGLIFNASRAPAK